MPDDNTLDNAGPIGREIADALTEKVVDAIDKFPAHSDTQRGAILRIVSNSLSDRAEEYDINA